MDLIDEQDRARIGLDFLHDGLEAFLEVAAIAGACEQRTHVEREHRRIVEHLRNLAAHDLAREPFGNRRLADARIADIERIVLGPAAQHLDGALDLLVAADQRIDPAVLRLLVQVDAIGFERVGAALLAVLALDGGGIVLHAADAARFGHAGALRDAVADEIHRVEAGHVLLGQEEGRVALALGEHRD